MIWCGLRMASRLCLGVAVIFEFAGKPSPNPALIPGGVEQDIWIVR